MRSRTCWLAKPRKRRSAYRRGLMRCRPAFSNRGFTLIELIVTVTVIAILVGMAIPLTRNTIRRQKETELRQALHEMRIAIDKYKDASDKGQIQQNLGTEGYP